MKVRDIKKLRTNYPLSLRELAEKADVAIETIRRAERGEGIQPANVRKLAAALDVQVKDIMIIEDDDEEAEPNTPTSALVSV